MQKMVSTTMIIKRLDDDIEVEVTAFVDYHVEKRYGEDADGNRGEARIFIDDMSEIEAFNLYNGKEVILSADENYRANELLTERFLEIE